MTTPETGAPAPRRRQDVLEALAIYQKQGRLQTDYEYLSDLLVDESDRGIVVILGSLVEDALLERVVKSFVPLEPSHRKRLDRQGGLLSTFADRITLAHALGLIDQNTVDALEVLKAMRNACAHSRIDIGFHTPELQDALQLLFVGRGAKVVTKPKNKVVIRLLFTMAVAVLIDIINGIGEDVAYEKLDEIMKEFSQRTKGETNTLVASIEKQTGQLLSRFRQDPKA